MQESLRKLRCSEVSVPALTSKVAGLSAPGWDVLGEGDSTTTLESGLSPRRTRGIIDETCREATGKSVSDTRFRHLSSWKPHGAFLVEATMSGWRGHDPHTHEDGGDSRIQSDTPTAFHSPRTR